MAKRRVGNPLFDTEEAEQLINLQDPGFLQSLNESGIPEEQDVEGLAMEDPMLPPPLPVKDARQIPLNPEDDPQLKEESNIPEDWAKSMSNLDMDTHPTQDYPTDARNTPNDWVKSMSGIDLNNPPEEEYPQDAIQGIASLATEHPQDNSDNSEGFKKGMFGISSYEGDEGDGFIQGLTGSQKKPPPVNKIAPGEDMYTQGIKSYADKMSNLPPAPKDESQQGKDFIRALGGESPNKEEEYPQDALQGISNFAENQPEDIEAEIPPANTQGSPQEAEIIEKIATGAEPIKTQITEDEIMKQSQQASKPVQGAVELAEDNPYVMSEIARLNGVAEVPPELMQYAKEWEAVRTKQKEELNGREQSLLEKLESGQLSDFDKIGLALSIALPVVMGLMYGGTGFILGAGAALESYGKAKSDEARGKVKAVEQLQNVNKDRAKLAEEGLKAVKMKQEIENNVPNKEVSNFVKNKKFREFGDDVGIGMGDEDKILWMNSEKLADADDLKKIKDRTKEAEETIGTVSNFNKQLDGIDDILIAIQDQDPGLWNVLKSDYSFLEKNSPDKIANSSFSDILSMISKTGNAPEVMIDIVGRDGKTRKINALEALSQQVKALQNDYNSSVLKGSRLTQNVMTHWSGIMFDPKSIAQFMTQGVNGWQENAFNLRNIMNRKIQEELTGYGFIREPIQQKYPVMEREILKPIAAVNRDITNNPDAYKNKVR